LVRQVCVVPIRRSNRLNFALCIADDLAWIDGGRRRAIVNALRVVTAVTIEATGVTDVATVKAASTILIAAALLAVGLLLATLLATLLPALLATLLPTALLATFALLSTLLALALLLALTLLLTIGLLLALLAALLSVLALLAALAVLALLRLSELLLQTFNLRARAFDRGYLPLAFALTSGLLVAAAHFALCIANRLTQLVERLR
jgi:hypothetical protein